MSMVTANEFVEKAKGVLDKKTVYLWGTFGAPLTETVISQKSKQYPSFYTASKQAELRQYLGKGYFAFDCVGLIKGLLWGWSGTAATYGGAKYQANDVPDIDANMMIKKCNPSTDFKTIEAGEVVWLQGHIGIYIGDGKVIEASTKWSNGVQVTALGNIGSIKGYNTRSWTSHGKLPWIEYSRSNADIVRTMKNKKYISNETYWLNVLDGKQVPNPDYLKAIFEKL